MHGGDRLPVAEMMYNIPDDYDLKLSFKNKYGTCVK